MTLKKYLLIPDCHVPFHDRAAFRLALRAAKAIKANNAVVLGDFLDFFAVSSHPKDPSRKQDLQAEIDAGNAALDEIDSVCRGERIYIEGNHEERLQRYLTDKAPALFRTLSLPKLLNVTKRGWKFVPYRDHVRVGRMFFTHDCGKAGRSANIDAMNAFQGNVVIGHNHRMSYNVEGSARGKPHLGATLGWLGDFSQLDYGHKIRAQRDWVHGFGVMYVEPGGNVHVTPVPIVDGKCLVEGRLIR